MKARIAKSYGLYHGEIYGNWENVFGIKWEGRECVTPPCFTKAGAMVELRKWKERKFPEEFDL